MQDKYNRQVSVTITTKMIQSDDMVKFIKSNGFITLVKYCEKVVIKHSDELVKALLKENYIVAVAKSDELNMSIGVSRKGLGELHKMFQRLEIAKVYSKKIGYVVILGKRNSGIDKFFIGDSKFYDSEIENIEEIYSNVSDRNVSQRNVTLGNTEDNIIPYIDNIDSQNKVIKKVKKLKVKSKEEKKDNNILDKIKKVNEKSKRDKEEYEGSIKKRNESKNNPSQKIVYQRFKSKEVEDWNCEDFLGYYLSRYKEVVGIEDVDFIGISRANTKTLLMNIGKFKQAYFSKSNEDLKNYIDWAIDFILNPDTWVDGTPSIYSLMVNKLSKNLVKDYLVQKTKSKVVKNRMKVDSDCANTDYWSKKYLQE